MEVLHIYDEKIPVILERSKGARISLRFRPERQALVVRTPSGKLTQQAQAFLVSKKRWIVRNFRKISQMHTQRAAFWQQLSEGVVPYLGKPHRVHIRSAAAFSVQVEAGRIIWAIRGQQGPEITPAQLKQMLRYLAKAYLVPKTQELARQTDSQVNRIFIKDQKSKWGSCSSQRNINLNWHLILLPPVLIDYLIVHELMHLREMNHSPAYWQWVARYFPGYKEAQKALHEYDWVIGVLDSWPEGGIS